MILTVLQILFVVSAVLSSFFFVLIYLGWKRALRLPPERVHGEDATVIVAAHNEVNRIPHLLEALAAQSVNAERFRVIVVDDRSDDGTAEAVRAHAGRLRCDVVRVDEVPTGVSPKKYALHRGIGLAATPVVLLTDADCVPEPEWIAAMTRVLARGSDVVLGLAPLEGGSGAAARYAAFESRRTMTLMTAAASWGKPYMASGRSWGFRRAVYAQAGGLEPLYAHLGGDDDLLLQRMAAAGARVGTCIEPGSMVLSAPPANWGVLLRQKLRHYRVSSSYRGAASVLLALFVVSELLVPLLGVLLTVLLPDFLKVLPLVIAGWKLWYDSGFLVASFKWMRGEDTRPMLAIREGFHIFYAVIVGIFSHVKPQRW